MIKQLRKLLSALLQRMERSRLFELRRRRSEILGLPGRPPILDGASSGSPQTPLGSYRAVKTTLRSLVYLWYTNVLNEGEELQRSSILDNVGEIFATRINIPWFPEYFLGRNFPQRRGPRKGSYTRLIHRITSTVTWHCRPLLVQNYVPYVRL